MLRFLVQVATQVCQPSYPRLISPFSRKNVFSAPANPFRFIRLRTPSSDGNPLLFSFQQITHSFPSHGTGPLVPARLSTLHFPVSNPVCAKCFSYRTYKKHAGNPFVCRTYKNKGVITPVFAALTKITGVFPSNSHFGTRSALASLRSRRYPSPVCATRAPRGSLATFALNPNGSRSGFAQAHI